MNGVNSIDLLGLNLEIVEPSTDTPIVTKNKVANAKPA
jgi:hypothetical protein